jgi:hypothetical protein
MTDVRLYEVSFVKDTSENRAAGAGYVISCQCDCGCHVYHGVHKVACGNVKDLEYFADTDRYGCRDCLAICEG